MADVIFEEEQEGVSRPVPVSAQPSAIIKIVYKLGLAKTQKSAEYVLIGVIIVCVVLSIGLLFFGGVFRSTPAAAQGLGPQQASTPAGTTRVP